MGPGEVSHALIPPGKVGEDLAPGGIGQGGKGAVESSRGILNHLVKY